MALLDSKQLNPRLTGSFTLSGSLSGDSASTGSFGYLNVTGNANLIGDLTLGGDIQIGDSSGDSISIAADLTSNLTPNVDSTYDLGTTSKNWRVGYIEQIVGETVTTSGNVSGSSTSTGSFGRIESTTANIGSADIAGNLTVAGNYTVNGTTTFISSSQLDIGDNIIQVNSVNPLRYGGLHVKDVTAEETGSLVWDSTNDYWLAGQSGSEYRIPIQTGNSNLTDNRVIIAQGNGRIESGNITDTGASISMTLPVTASSNLEIAGNISGSSTSTGSFGYVNADSISSPSDLNIYTSNGSYNPIFARTNDGVAIGKTMAFNNRNPHAPLHVVGGTSDIGIFVHSDRNGVGDHTGIGFGVWDYNYAAKGAIFFERRGLYGIGKLKFAVDSVADGGDVTPSETVMTITSASIELANNIFLSGSATSTGSFGRLEIGGGGGITAEELVVTNITASGNISASGTIYADNFTSTGQDVGGISFADDLNITGDITGSGNLEIAGNISGSSTSTGSFGSVVVADHVLGSLKVKASSNAIQIYDSGNGNNYLNIHNNDIKAPSGVELNLYSHNTLALKLETDQDARFYGDVGIGKSPATELDVQLVHSVY